MAKAGAGVRRRRTRGQQAPYRGQIARVRPPTRIVLYGRAIESPPEVAAVGEASMVSSDRERQHSTKPPRVGACGLSGARCRVVDTARGALVAKMADVSLERCGALADVMQQSGNPCRLAPAEMVREGCGLVCHFVEMSV